MKSENLFEILTDIDDKFVDTAYSEQKPELSVRSQELRVNKRRFPWGIAAACLTACIATGTVIAISANRNGLTWNTNPNTTSTKAECVFRANDYDSTEIGETYCEFTMDEYPDLAFRVTRQSGALGGPTLCCVEDNVEYRLISGYEIFLCDFDGDGEREICANYSIGSGIVVEYVTGYDPKDSLLYTYNAGDDVFQSRFIMVDDELKIQVSAEMWLSDEDEIRPLELVKTGKLLVDNSVVEYGDELNISVNPSKFEYNVGENIPVDVEVTNVSGKPIYLWTGYEAMYNDGTSDEEKPYIIDGDITRNDVSLYNKSRPFAGDSAIGTIRLEQNETYSARLNFEATAGENTPVGMYQGTIFMSTCYDHDYDSAKNYELKFPIRIIEADDSNVPNQSKVTEIYTENSGKELPFDFTIDELGELAFCIDKDKNIFRYSAPNMNIFGWGVFSDKVYVRSVYLCDLNEDGIRELIAAVTNENGEKSVRAYDFGNKKEYEYNEKNSPRGEYDSLTIKNGSLYLCTEDGSDSEQLRLNIMKPITNVNSLPTEEIYTENSGKKLPLVFKLNEFSEMGVKISLNPDLNTPGYLDICLVNTTTGDEARKLFTYTSVIKEVYAADLDGDGHREIVAAVNDFGPNSTGSSAGYYCAFDIINNKYYQLIDGNSSEENRKPYDHLLLKDGSLYLCSEDGSAVSEQPLTLNDMKAINITDDPKPENPNKEPNSQTGGTYITFDKISMNVYTDNSGELISVTAEITNTTDKTIYLYASNIGDIVHVDIRNGGNPLLNTRMFLADAIEIVEIKPGEIYTGKQTFTRYTGYDDFTREPAKPGEYQGMATVEVMSDRSDFSSDSMTYCTVPFTVVI